MNISKILIVPEIRIICFLLCCQGRFMLIQCNFFIMFLSRIIIFYFKFYFLIYFVVCFKKMKDSFVLLLIYSIDYSFCFLWEFNIHGMGEAIYVKSFNYVQINPEKISLYQVYFQLIIKENIDLKWGIIF